jgi:hypothetical protein
MWRRCKTRCRSLCLLLSERSLGDEDQTLFMIHCLVVLTPVVPSPLAETSPHSKHMLDPSVRSQCSLLEPSSAQKRAKARTPSSEKHHGIGEYAYRLTERRMLPFLCGGGTRPSLGSPKDVLGAQSTQGLPWCHTPSRKNFLAHTHTQTPQTHKRTHRRTHTHTLIVFVFSLSLSLTHSRAPRALPLHDIT